METRHKHANHYRKVKLVQDIDIEGPIKAFGESTLIQSTLCATIPLLHI